MSLEIIQTGVDLGDDLEKLARAIKNPAKALHRIGAMVKDKVRIEYAPKSPTMTEAQRSRLASQIVTMRASGLRGIKLRAAIKNYKRLSRKISKALKKSSATTRAKPGSLQNSVEFEKSAGSVTIFVATNSPAGKYARKIHDEKGKTWHNRGAGTRAKGSKADDKFIERAINDSEPDILVILENEISKQAGL